MRYDGAHVRAGKRVDALLELGRLHFDELLAAMHDVCARNRVAGAPPQLGANRRMTEQRVATTAHERSRERRAVADVDIDAGEDAGLIGDRDDVGIVDDGLARDAYAKTDGGRANRVHHVVGLHAKRPGPERSSRFDDAKGYGIVTKQRMRLPSDVGWCIRSAFECKRVVRMRVRDRDPIRLESV